MTTMPVNGFILAGGRSTRMGSDKALLDWHGVPLLRHMVGILQYATDNVQVVGRDRLPDLLPSRGPLSGIATALTITSTECNLILAIDLPLLTKDFLAYFRQAAEHSKRPVLACKIRSHFPLCLGIRRSLLPEIQRRLSGGDLSVRGLIEHSDAEVISEPQLHAQGFASSIFRNLNRPEDYRHMHGLNDTENSGTDS
jgi:molybdopterin-guanine dinucleotide biosynthesis protein A